jgi:two-component system phosphate regulon sensor histidine kinase PhoR
MRLEIDLPERLDVVGDSHELTRLFQNLVDNALKYGDRGTAVRIHASVTRNMARVAVSDRGPGIPREHIPRLTERFYRVDKGRSRVAGGTGLGLAIVKHVVNRHRGELKISSVENEGSTFTVELPLAPG